MLNKVIPLKAPNPHSDAAIDLTELTDDQLAVLARGGMTSAFEVLVKRHYRMVYRIALKYLGNLETAQDVAQECFVDFYRSLTVYDPQGKIISYLGKITINRCRMALRAQKSEMKALKNYCQIERETSSFAEQQILHDETRREIERCLGKMSPKLREVLILRFGAEMSYKEIAATLKIRIGTVKSRVFTGIEKLAEQMRKGAL